MTIEDETIGWHHLLDGHNFAQGPGIGYGQEAWHAAVHGVAKSWTQLSDWTEPQQDNQEGKINDIINPHTLQCAMHKMENNYSVSFSHRSENSEARFRLLGQG